MTTNDSPPLSDRQARTVILAAEALGFQREPDLYAAWYDHDLHEDAAYAAKFLSARDPDALREALVADEPISADTAAERITDSGRFNGADAAAVIAAATDLGFTPPPPLLGALEFQVQWDQARASVAFLWDHDPARLAEVIGEVARIAPLPETARIRGQEFDLYEP
jgi:hypothetical protein